jgi:NAD(P)-dependent dehydrogenase (short-subunit alcohol dehydrogenase family)
VASRFGRQQSHPKRERRVQLAALHPVGRLGEISDIVDAIMYLEEAGFVTGEIPHVDGGQSAGH